MKTDRQQAIKILKNTGYIGNEVGVALEVAIKSMDKLEKIEEIVRDYDTNCGLEEYMYLEQIKEVLERE